MSESPQDHAVQLLERTAALLHDCRDVGQALQDAPAGESEAAQAERVAYRLLAVALEEGLVRTLEAAARAHRRARPRHLAPPGRPGPRIGRPQKFTEQSDMGERRR